MEPVNAPVVREVDFEEGKVYTYYLQNKGLSAGLFVLPSMITATGSLVTVSRPDGSEPEVVELDEDWPHGEMGGWRQALYQIEEGYYLIHVHTPSGFDFLLDKHSAAPLDPLVVVSLITRLENLEVLGCMQMVVQVMERFRASEMSYIGSLTNRVSSLLEQVCGYW